MLFSNKRQHALVIPAADQDGKPANIANLIDHLCQNVMDDSRKDLFVLNSHLYVLATHCLSPSLLYSLPRGPRWFKQTQHNIQRFIPPIYISNPILPVAVTDKSGKQSTRNPGTHKRCRLGARGRGGLRDSER